jgi:hypothetical protein
MPSAAARATVLEMMKLQKPRTRILGVNISANLSNEIVVVFVCADPKPDHEVAVLLCNSAITIADSRGPDVSNKWLELH